MRHTPTISVIIPAHNEEVLIGECLQALEKQTYPKEKYEIIVVDNNSTDQTGKIARSFPVTVLQYTKMSRVSAARQYGAAHARGAILAFMDADSMASADWLEMIEKELQKTDLVAICGPALPLQSSRYFNALFWVYNQFLRINQVLGYVFPWGFNLAIKKKNFDAIGGYNLSLRSADDAELGLRLQRTFGRKSVRYSQDLKVFTSTRKQEDSSVFFTYMRDGIINYVNLVILNKTKTADITNVR